MFHRRVPVGGLTDWLDGMSEDLLKLAVFCYSSFILDKGRSVRKRSGTWRGEIAERRFRAWARLTADESALVAVMPVAL